MGPHERLVQLGTVKTRIGTRTEQQTAMNVYLNLHAIRRNKWVHRAWKMALVFGLVVVIAGGAFYGRYPGLVNDLCIEFASASNAELVDQYAFLKYYAEYYGKLRYNSKTKQYDFAPVAAEYGAQPDHVSQFEHGLLCYHVGDYQGSIDHILLDIDDRGETEAKLFWLGLSYQRLAEEKNCAVHCRCKPASRYCSLPIRATHAEERPSRKAIEVYQRLLDDYDPENGLYRWLLNFSYITLGEFPDGVPDRYRVSGDFVDSFYGSAAQQIHDRYANLSFRESGHELGVNLDDAGKGVAVEDFDGDGFLDVVTGGTFGKLHYFKNDQGIRFVDRTQQAGLDCATQPYITTAADYDNDGAIDLFVSRPFHHFLLLRNRGDGTFDDVTFQSGLLSRAPRQDEAVYTCVSAWGDVNNDGYLDLFLAQFGQRFPLTGGLLARRPMSSKLFLSVPQEDGGDSERRFRDATAEYGLADVVSDRIYLGASFGDYDGDGWADLFLSSFVGRRTVLLRNHQGKRFEPTDSIRTSGPGFTSAFVDVNHDGQLDLFLGGFGPARSITENVVFGRRTERYGSLIFLQHDGRFEARRDLFQNGMAIGTMGASFGDLNNDGAYDFYLGTGSPQGEFVLPNLMYIGQTDGYRATGRATNASMLHGFGTVQKGHGIVFFDYDNDGDEDIYSSLGGMWPGDAWPNQMFVNDSTLDAAWVKIRLRGRRTNRYGVGAIIRVEAVDNAGEPIVRYYHMSNKTGFGSAPYLAHIGLMNATRVAQVEVYWPVSRERKTYPARLRELNVLDEDAGFVATDRLSQGFTSR